MNPRIYFYYRLSDGLLTGETITMPNETDLPLPVDGIGLITGVHDWRTSRVDLTTGELMPYHPHPLGGKRGHE